MTLEFTVDRTASAERIDALSALDPPNPFCTRAYVEARRRLGEEPLLLLLLDAGRVVGGCAGFMKAGRLNSQIEIPSRPALSEDSPFWPGLQSFCRDAAVTQLHVNSFGSAAGIIPDLGHETGRKRRAEYLIDLGLEEPFRKPSKGHAYRIKRAKKSGVTLRRTRDESACREHALLIDASMQRRVERGEDVSLGGELDPLRVLLATGAAELFQAVSEDRVLSSNMFLLAPGGGYSHTSGTNPDGMKCGAAHFLIHETALALREQGMTVCNLGGTDQEGGGLEQFKLGFSADMRKIELEAASFRCATIARRALRGVTGLLQGGR